MNVLVTCGPAFEPIDEVRRLTNFSTGELGVRLSARLAGAGHGVTCFKGSGSTWRDPEFEPEAGPRFVAYDTNDDLLTLLESAAAAAGSQQTVGAVFHAAALCDYRVGAVEDEAGHDVRAAKIPSRSGRIRLVLEPATKLIPRLRPLFPAATIVGWKYELNGSRDDALRNAWKQIDECGTDACVLNGRAFGSGFALCRPPESVSLFAGKGELIDALTDWMKSTGEGS